MSLELRAFCVRRCRKKASSGTSAGWSSGATGLGYDTNPERIQFTYDLVILGQLNQAPSITSVPVIEAIVGQEYAYDADAVDPDNDPLSFSLGTNPAAMQIDGATGQIVWNPNQSDLGNQSVAVTVTDGRGGTAEQQYVVSVIERPPNRPPYFTSIPVVDAHVGQP